MIDMPEGTRTMSKHDINRSKFNNGHVLIVRDLLNLLLHPQTGIQAKDVVVITPYLAQCMRHIRTLKEASKNNPVLEDIIVSTVDKFEGQESNIIVLDLVVRSNGNSTFGFMSDKHCLNVTISRARDVLIVVGDAHKYRRLNAKAVIPTQYRKFLEVMADIANNTVL
jgi:hypothetical protein